MTLPFEQDDWFTLVKLNGEEFTDYYINIYAKDKINGGAKILVHKTENYTLGEGKEFNIEYKISVDYLFYNEAAKLIAGENNPLPTQIEFILELVVNSEDENGTTSTEEEEIEDTLTVHFVRYMPKIMNILGFSNGEYLQRLWFTLGNNIDKKAVNPELEAVTWSWLVSESSRVRDDYSDFISESKEKLNAWVSNKVKRSLQNEVNRMIDEGLTVLPTKESGNQPFGVVDSQIITYNDEKMPKFEKYYFNSEPFDSSLGDLTAHFALDGLDDFIAALANFNFHMLAIGELVYDDGYFSDEIDINIQQLGIYIKDSYDFIDDDPNEDSQPLGFWRILGENDIKVKRSPWDEDGYYEVTNKLYRDYRDEHATYEEGYNYHLYSDINYIKTDITFKLKDA